MSRAGRALRMLTPLWMLLAGCGGGEPGERRPNIIVLVVDCLRADRLREEYARPAATAMRAFAREGVSFDNAFAQASWTRPSVSSILTGLYPSELGLGPELTGDKASTVPESVVTLAEALQQTGYSTALIAEQYQFADRFGLNQGWDKYHYRADQAGNIHRHLRQFAADAGHRPFFAYLHYLEIHWPYCSPAPSRGAFLPMDVGMDFCHDWKGLNARLRRGDQKLADIDKVAMPYRYDEEIFALDSRLRELFAWLKTSGLWDDTLVILTADHGEEFFEHGDFGHGHIVHDEVLHVPLVIKPPEGWGAAPGTRNPGLVESRDIAATVLEAAGAKTEGSRGRSLVPWLGKEPPDESPHEVVMAEASLWMAARSREWKLIVSLGDASERLFHLTEDPLEQKDVAAERPAELLAMRQKLREWRRSLRSSGAQAVRPMDKETEENLRALGYIQ